MKIFRNNTYKFQLPQKILMQPITSNPKRELSLDIARGITVIIMVLTHVIAFTYDHSATNSIVYNLGLFGGIVSFSSFLFLSGLSSVYAYFRHDFEPENTQTKSYLQKVVKNATEIILVFYFLATVALVVNDQYQLPLDRQWVLTTLRTITFLNVPEFTEFLITLAFFVITIGLFRPVYKFLLKNYLLILPLGVLSFLAGLFVYQLDFKYDVLNQYKSLIGGFGDLHTFPVFQYFPIFLVGLLLGRLWLKVDSFSKKLTYVLIFLIGTLGLTIADLLLLQSTDKDIFLLLPTNGARFPPTAGFLVLSLTLSLVILLFSLFVSKIHLGKLVLAFTFPGLNALKMFVFHLLLLFGYKFVTLQGDYDISKFAKTYEILLAFLVTYALSLLFTWLMKYFDADNKKYTPFNVNLSQLSQISLFVFVFGLILFTSIYTFDAKDFEETDWNKIYQQVDDEQTPSEHVELTLNKKWFLLGNQPDFPKEININATISVEDKANIVGVYELTGPNTNQTAELTLVDDKWVTTLSSTDYSPGEYKLQVSFITFSKNVYVFKSEPTSFYISHPLYVSWTMDWEGWGVANYDLQNIINVASTYGIPITHFFNPRIYTKDQNFYQTISPESADYLTSWIKNRHYLGDEIGMHLHMFPDMLKELEIPVRSEAYPVGAMYGDTLLKAYSEEELTKIITWGKEQFELKGLPQPKSFRAGGWQASNALMRALVNTDFDIDSSGRTGGVINPAVPTSTSVPWNLSILTRPYLISVNDMGSWEGERLSLWEFPNNGADSYWFSVDELKKRLDDNFSDKQSHVMNYPQVVTYLSHPHWFTGVDYGKISETFAYTTNFAYKDDKGPIIYSTLSGILQVWDQQTYIDGD